MGINIIKRIGKKALWICHTGDLLRQAEHDFKKLFPNVKIGLTTEGELNIGEDVTISTVQTLVKIDPELYKNEFETVVIDECVHCTSTPTQMKMFGSVISQIKARYKFGLTATPNRPDGMDKTMYAYIGCNRKGEFKQMYTVPRSAVKTITAEHVKVELNSGFDDWQMYKIVNRAGMIEYNKLMSGLVESEERTNKIIENILKCHKEGRKQVVLSHRIEHCEIIVEKLKEQGVDALLCVGKISNKKRDDILKQRVKWDVIVATYQLLKEGISINELDTLHMTTPFKDGNTAVQCAGRVERYLENKKQPIVYDYVDIDIPYCEKRFVDRRRALKRRLKENG
jgi:superfamily II DNA or RNA helicase